MPKKLITKLFTTLFVSCLFLGSAAQAAPLPAETFADSTGLNAWTFGNSYPTGTEFTDAWSFNLQGDTAVAIDLTSFVLPGSTIFSIGDLTASLDSVTGTSFTTGILSAGIHQLVISGNSNGLIGGVYSGTISAVPLPAAAWLFGSALVAFLTFARRRNQREQYA